MTWQHWVNFVLAIWLIVSGYVVTAAYMVTNLWIVGIVMAVLALWGALEGSSTSARVHRAAM
jgi:hypothetical protein